MTKYMNRKIEIEEIAAWRFDTYKAVEVKVIGEWYGYSSGPTMAEELLELLLAGVPREPDAAEVLLGMGTGVAVETASVAPEFARQMLAGSWVDRDYPDPEHPGSECDPDPDLMVE